MKSKMSEGGRGKGRGAGGRRSEAGGQLATAKPQGRRREVRKANGFTLVELPAVSKRAFDLVELPAVSRRGFTLVELLAVIAIMTILFVIAVPSLETFTRKGLSTSIAPLTTTLRLARQYAVTHRETVYVVFPDRDNTDYSGSEVDRALRSYAVIASNRTEGFYYVADWRYLPKGVSFIPDRTGEGTGTDVFKSNSGMLFPFSPPNGNRQEMPAVQFRSNGRTYFYNGGWSPFSVRIKIPVTSARYFEVATNTGTVGPSTHVVGSTNLIYIDGMTGQISVRYEDNEGN